MGNGSRAANFISLDFRKSQEVNSRSGQSSVQGDDDNNDAYSWRGIQARILEYRLCVALYAIYLYSVFALRME